MLSANTTDPETPVEPILGEQTMNEAQYAVMQASEEEHWWYVGRRSMIRTTLDALALPDSASICEIGCGFGGNLLMLSGFGKLCAIEAFPEARKIAAQRALCPVFSGSLPDSIQWDAIIEPQTRTFDLICAFDVIEHVHDHQSALINISKMLRPGGYLVLTVPAYPSLWSEHDEVHQHCRRYTSADLAELGRTTGFIKKRLGYFNFFLFLPIAAVKLMGNFFPMKRPNARQAELHAISFQAKGLTNRLLTKIFSFESSLVKRLGLTHFLPWGISLIAVFQKPISEAGISTVSNGRNPEASAA